MFNYYYDTHLIKLIVNRIKFSIDNKHCKRIIIILLYTNLLGMKKYRASLTALRQDNIILMI